MPVNRQNEQRRGSELYATMLVRRADLSVSRQASPNTKDNHAIF